jgi:hypothetical protein
MQPPENPQGTPAGPQDVLTLHRGIYDRWLAENGRGMATRQVPTSLALSSDRLIAHLPGLAAMAGTFGTQAWDLATSVAQSPQLLSKLGLEARTLQIGDLADLLQLVLDEEELSQEAEALEGARTRTSAIEKQASARTNPQSKSPVGRPTPARTQTTGRRPAPGQASKLRAIRQMLADLRTREAKASAALSGASTPDVAGQVGRLDPDQSGTQRAAPGQAASATQDRTESLGILRTQAPRARMAADRWLDPASRAQDVASLPRSLRMAEQAAELALLEPGPEGFAAANDGASSAASTWIDKEGSRGAAVQGRASTRVDSTARAEVSAPHAVASAQAVKSDARLPAAAWAATLARRPQANRAFANPAQTWGASTPRGNQTVGVTASPAFSDSAPASGTRAALAQAAQLRARQADRAQVNASPAILSQPGQLPGGAARPALADASAQAFRAPLSLLPALGGAVAWAARQLSRLQDFEATASGSRQIARAQARTSATAGAASAAPSFTEASSAGAASRAVGGASAPQADRYAPLFARGEADAARGQAALPRWTAWLAKAEVALTGRAAPAGSRTGYTGSELGAGDWLLQAADGAPASSEESTGSAPTRRSAAQAAARAASASAVPAWIAPAVSRAAAASAPRSAAAQAFAGSAAATAARGGASAAEVSALRGDSADRRSAAPGGFEVAGASQARAAGLVGLDSIGMGTRLSGRLLAGLEPIASGLESSAWAPRGWLAAEAQAGRTAERATLRGFAGDLGADAGAGEWLVATAESGADAESGATARPGENPASATRRGAAATQGSAQPRAVAGTAAAAGTPARRAAARTPGAWAGAAAAAIERVVAQSARSGRLTELMRHVAQGRSVVDFASGADAQVLAARPYGARDAVTPWIEKHLARQQVRAMENAGGDADLVNLQPGLESGGEQGATATRAPQTGVAAGTRAGRAPTETASNQARSGATGARPAARMATGALEALRSPAAVRAALALFGNTLPQGAGTDVATAFLARWFGRADVAKQAAQTLGRGLDAGRGAGRESPGAIVGLRDDPMGLSDSVATRQGQAVNASPGEGADGFVLTGLAALAAIRGPRQEIDQLATGSTPRDMKTPDVERALLAPTATSGATEGTEAEAPRSIAGRAPRKGTTAQLHDFVPIGLRRGRDLLSSQRRSQGLMRVTPRSGLMGRGVGRSQARVGYGAAELGGGELLGLNNGETTSFYGESGPMPSAVRGADRLSGIVEARRTARTGRGHAAAVAANTGVQRTFTGGGDNQGPEGLPSDFSYGQQGLVNPAAAMQAAVAQSGRNQGASAAMRSVQAGAMARVLSVTSTPGANMLPLVAPAASALVAAAAAKPLSESIVTSGSDPSMGMPLHDMGANGKKNAKGGGGGGEGSHDGHHAEDLEALAQKIARSVMTRIKRERERRGIHG